METMEIIMRNRYGNEYEFVKVNNNTYTITGDLKYWRMGGREGVEGLGMSNLGFVDPSGGPFIDIGYEIERRKVINIASTKDGIFFTVEEENE
jgi:hypothetical protein